MIIRNLLNRPFFNGKKWAIFIAVFSFFFLQAQNDYLLFSYENNRQITKDFSALTFKNKKLVEIKSNQNYTITIENMSTLDSIYINLNEKLYRVRSADIKIDKIFIKQVDDLNEVMISVNREQKNYTLKSFSNNICKVYQGSGKTMNLIHVDSLKGSSITSLELYIKRQTKSFRKKKSLRIGIQLGSVNSLDSILVKNIDSTILKNIPSDFSGWLKFDFPYIKIPNDSKYLAVIAVFYDAHIIIPCPTNKAMREEIFLPTLYRPLTDRGKIIEDRWVFYNEEMILPTANPFAILPLKINTTNFLN